MAIRLICRIVLVAALIFSPWQTDAFAASGYLFLPKPGVPVGLSDPMAPMLLRGFTLHPEDPLRIDFIVDGLSKQELDACSASGRGQHCQFSQQALRLIRYFFTSLTMPKEDMWVNLSPYEKDRIIPSFFGQTAMGRDLLAQDYVLKQLTATLLSPLNPTGKQLWVRIYRETLKRFGTTQLPVNTYNKVWIIPNQVKLFQKDQTVIIAQATLKVMLEEDYLAMNKNKDQKKATNNTQRQPGDMFQQNQQNVSPSRLLSESPLKVKAPQGNTLTMKPAYTSKEIIKETVLPLIEQEINQGKNFALLRQAYYALVLSMWYKKHFATTDLGQSVIDKAMLKGIQLPQDDIAYIYHQYLAAYKSGASTTIQAETDASTGQKVIRKYFSGGFKAQAPSMAMVAQKEVNLKNPASITVRLREALKQVALPLFVAGALASGSSLAADTKLLVDQPVVQVAKGLPIIRAHEHVNFFKFDSMIEALVRGADSNEGIGLIRFRGLVDDFLLNNKNLVNVVNDDINLIKQLIAKNTNMLYGVEFTDSEITEFLSPAFQKKVEAIKSQLEQSGRGDKFKDVMKSLLGAPLYMKLIDGANIKLEGVEDEQLKKERKEEVLKCLMTMADIKRLINADQGRFDAQAILNRLLDQPGIDHQADIIRLKSIPSFNDLGAKQRIEDFLGFFKHLQELIKQSDSKIGAYLANVGHEGIVLFIAREHAGPVSEAVKAKGGKANVQTNPFVSNPSQAMASTPGGIDFNTDFISPQDDLSPLYSSRTQRNPKPLIKIQSLSPMLININHFDIDAL